MALCEGEAEGEGLLCVTVEWRFYGMARYDRPPASGHLPVPRCTLHCLDVSIKSSTIQNMSSAMPLNRTVAR